VSSCDPHCITCGDVGVAMRVVRLEEGLAVCEADGEQRTVETAFVEGVEPGDSVLVHADVALVKL
jgi:hydrogenase maturation factor